MNYDLDKINEIYGESAIYEFGDNIEELVSISQNLDLLISMI